MKIDIKKNVSDYYSEKIKLHGATSAGVDWNGKESQYVRFDQLSKVIQNDTFSILDYGCGYGEYINYLKGTNSKYQYKGFDISEEMIKSAIALNGNDQSCFFSKESELKSYDYTVASGIFNVRNEVNDKEWLAYILDELSLLNKLSNKGFSFNALTKYSDKEYLKDYLYYADPLFLFDYCKQHFSRNVALLHDYELYEFTLIVKK